jgi:hypothetical protein
MTFSGADYAYALGGDATLLYSKLLGAGGFGPVHEILPFEKFLLRIAL